MWGRKFKLELSGANVNATFTDFRMDFRYNEYFSANGLTNMADVFSMSKENLVPLREPSGGMFSC